MKADDNSKRALEHGRGLSFYIFLFLIVVPVVSIIPLSWTFLLYSVYYGSYRTFSYPGKVVVAIALLEVFFSIYYFNSARVISRPSPIDPGNPAELQTTFQRVLQSGLTILPEDGFDEESLDVDRPGSPAGSIEVLGYSDSRAADFRNYFRNWFGKVPWSSIRRKEMSMWLYWSIFNSTMPPQHAIPESHSKAVNERLELIEKRAGCKIPDGCNPSVKPVLLTLDPVNVLFRPLLWYVVVAIINFFARIYLWHYHQVQFGTHQNLEYLVRIPHNWNVTSPNNRPVVFVHGIGLGIFQYVYFISRMIRELPDRPILVLIQPHISQEIFRPRFLSPMGRRETIKSFVGLLEELGWNNHSGEVVSEGGITMLSHSYGSFVHAWLLKERPEIVSRSCFIDPVTFCSFEGDLCYNFLYRRCKTATDLMLYYFGASELGVANVLHRHFDWSSNSLWYEEVPNARDPSKSMFVLGGSDSVINASRVARYLRSHGVRKGLVFTPDHQHGQALIPSTKVHQDIFRWLLQ